MSANAIHDEKRTRCATPEDAARGVLRSVFGFEDFRTGQEEVVASVLRGSDTLAVMPTSGGKSLCYQVPALMGEGGLTLVVSPLVSLMADQELSLRRRYEERGLGAENAPVAALHSQLGADEERKVEAGVLSGGIRILLVAPERLRSLEFVLSLKRASNGRGVGLFVVDEAHCVSEWGHSFRPEYLHAKRVIEDLRGKGRPEGANESLPVLALTATADARVRDDVVRLLGMRDPEVVLTGFDRPNLTYAVEKAEDGEEARAPRVLDALGRHGTPAIVYAGTRRQTESLAEALRDEGVGAEAYHAGMGGEARSAVQERFMTDKTRVVVATVAFGMGVDKPDVRNVIHAGLPASISAYVQEAGRAGRDGRPASCTVIYSAEEAARRKEIASRNLDSGPSAEDARAFFEALKERTTSGRRAYLSHRELWSLGLPEGSEDRERAGYALRALEGVGAVERRYDLWESVTIEGLSRRTPPRDDDATGPVAAVHAALLRLRDGRGRASSGRFVVGLSDLAREARLSRPVAQGAVMKLAALGALRAKGRGARADVVLKAKDLAPELLAIVEYRFGEAALKELCHLESVEAYASTSGGCRRQHLLSYFDDEAAPSVAPCDGCDVCRGRKKPLLSRFLGRAFHS